MTRFYRSKLTSKQETEANQYAADLLMPFSLINAFQEKGITDPEELARRLGVSLVAMKIRLGIPVPA
jgi:Zn-dependent peptidase ImmA (M78 family)